MSWCAAKFYPIHVVPNLVSWAVEMLSVSSSQCVGFCCCIALLLSHSSGDPESSAEDTLLFCWMPKHSKAIQHRADHTGQEVGCRNKILALFPHHY